MTRPRPVAAAALAALTLAAAPRPALPEGERLERFTGVARGLDGAVLYHEAHEVRRAGERLLSAVTVYSDPAGRPIATLRTGFEDDPFAPSYVFEDLRGGRAESVTRAPEGLVVRAGERSRTLALAREDGRRIATGQGLDRFVRARLEDLERGETLDLSYVIPSRQAAYDLRVRAVGAPRASGGEGKHPGAPVRVRVEFSSWLLRLLAPDLEVEYDRATRRLLRYRGASNLTDARGENPAVEITYAYPEDAPVAGGGLHGTR